MAKRKHRWHCGNCHADCLATRKGKGTKYIYCPKCGMVAYFNIAPLVAMLASSLAPMAIDAVTSKKSKKTDEKPSGKITFDNLDKPNKGERYVKMVLGE